MFHNDDQTEVNANHSWFQLVCTQSEQTVNDAYRQHGMYLYHVGGSLFFLDSLTPQLIAGKNVSVRNQVIKEFGPTTTWS